MEQLKVTAFGITVRHRFKSQPYIFLTAHLGVRLPISKPSCLGQGEEWVSRMGCGSCVGAQSELVESVSLRSGTGKCHSCCLPLLATLEGKHDAQPLLAL